MTQPAGTFDERSLLVQACIEVVGEVGYAQARMDAVILRAGLDESTAAHHFADKDDLFLAAWDAAQQKFFSAALPAFTEQSRWQDAIRAVAEACLRFVQDSPLEARTVAEARNGNEQVRERFEAMINALVDLIDLGRQELNDPDSLTRATAEGIVGAVYEQVTKQLARPGGFDDLPSLLPNLMFLVVRPYLGIESAAEELTREAA